MGLLEPAGGARAETLAVLFRDANSALAAFVDGLSEEQWKAPCPALSTTVGVAAHHVASAYGDLLSSVQARVRGEPVGRATQARLDERNARHNVEYRTISRSQALESLRRGATPLTSAIRSLTDGDLDRPLLDAGGRPQVAFETFVRKVVIGHGSGHLRDLRDAVRRPAQV